jgi:hypothetical protein
MYVCLLWSDARHKRALTPSGRGFVFVRGVLLPNSIAKNERLGFEEN